MVDVSGKEVTTREARAEAAVTMSEAAFKAACAGDLPKGDLVAVARLAGIMAAKRTADLVPFCHPLKLTDIDVEVTFDEALPGARLRALVRCVDRTGAEMEALTACAVAGLTVIDMVKAVDPWSTLTDVRVLAKSGGRSGSRTRGA
ncbi:MAG: cyclic pyranopterin monophosphate synthase [Chloroflexota bacterium]|jgi:cyclic pyranopterin phosphate synthase|nr:cyclic pyranopterin monophosphate synthase [Chloroflexota bacterium]